MKLHDVPSAENLPAYQTLPDSGNRINGQGVKEKVRPQRVFHAPWVKDLPWTGMNTFFLMNNTWRILLQAVRNRWVIRRSAGPVAKHKIQVNDPNEMARHLKQKAKELGAGVVGITEIQPHDLYEDTEIKHRYAISIGIPMRREEMQHVPHARSGLEVQRVYGEVARTAVELAEYQQPGLYSCVTGLPQSFWLWMRQTSVCGYGDPNGTGWRPRLGHSLNPESFGGQSPRVIPRTTVTMRYGLPRYKYCPGLLQMRPVSEKTALGTTVRSVTRSRNNAYAGSIRDRDWQYRILAYR